MTSKAYSQIKLFLIIAVILVESAICAAKISAFPIESDTTPQFWLDIGFFRSNGNGIAVDVYYSITNKELQFKNVDQEKIATFNISLQVNNSNNISWD